DGAVGEQAVLAQQRGQGETAQTGAGVVEEVAAVEQPAACNARDAVGHGPSKSGWILPRRAPRESTQLARSTNHRSGCYDNPMPCRNPSPKRQRGGKPSQPQAPARGAAPRAGAWGWDFQASFSEPLRRTPWARSVAS